MIKATKKPAVAGVGIRGRGGKPKQRYSTEALVAKEKAIGKNRKWVNIHIRRQLQE